MNMMGKTTRLYLSISLARIPKILVGGLGGRAGVLATGGKSGALVSEQTCLSVLSLGSVSTPSLTVQVSMQQVWNLTQACKHRNTQYSTFLIRLVRSKWFVFLCFLRGRFTLENTPTRNPFNFLTQ